MHIALQDQQSVKHAVRAAFIRADKPEAWLREISRWGILPGQLTCYLLPQSIGNIEAAGLFVVFKEGNVPPATELLEPYGLLANKLYVPQQTTLVPEVGVEELKKLLHWDVQVYHPAIGLVGFEKSDALDLSDLLIYGQQREQNWGFAHAGLSPKPGIKQIRVQQLSVEEVLENFKKSIAPKSLEDIPKKKEDETSTLGKIVDDVKTALLKGGLSAYNGLKSVFSGEASGGTAAGQNRVAQASEGDKPGLFQRLESWMLLNLEELEKKRNAEINRLLNLFDEDSDEALRYAIPLDSPYLGRGTAEPGARLTRHGTNFSLGSLGGGGAVDNWDIGKYYGDLRQKYQLKAQKEIEAKRHQKAAYIYAHLLGDFYAAAKALEEGKQYREAATLYKDHLKNTSSAAECLEKGGMLLEAIDLYAELNKHEKVGDLYMELEQTENAAEYYERCITQDITNNDYLDASRIIAEKLQQQERAREILLQGWQEYKQSEPCLKRYFELVSKEKAGLTKSVQEVYAQYTPKNKRSSFLNVLVHLNQQRKSEELLDTSRNLAYEIISEEAQEGNLQNMYSLKKFLQDDRLIAADCSRFINGPRAKPKKKTAANPLQLDKSIKWFQVLNHRNQILALGNKSGFLHLARGNWYGNLEYYSWPQSIVERGIIGMLAEPYFSQHVVLRSGVSLDLEMKTLPKNKYFDEALSIGSYSWLSDSLACVGINGEGTFTALKVHPTSGIMDLVRFDSKGGLQKTVGCTVDDGFVQSDQFQISAAMIFRNGHYYFFYENWLAQLDENGVLKFKEIESYIYNIVASDHLSSVKIAVGTDAGIQIMQPVAGVLVSATDPFAAGQVPLFMKFISSELLVIADQQQAIVFDISVTAPLVLQRVTSHSAIIGILSTAKRHQFALLTESGAMNVYDINVR